MESPIAASNQTNGNPIIRRAPGVSLPAAERDLLAQAFAGRQEILVEREFRSGYSGAAVLLVSPGPAQAPMVVKIAAPADLQREYAAYHQFVKDAAPQNTAQLRGKPLLAADGQRGLIIYTFAGGDPRLPTRSLQGYYEAQGAATTATVLRRIFRAYGRQWWSVNLPQKFVLGEQYDRLLPVHLYVEPVEHPQGQPQVLVAGQSGAVTVRKLHPGQHVRLEGFRVRDVQPDKRTLTLIALPPPDEASALLRIRVKSDKPFPYRAGDPVAHLEAVVTATRQTVLADAARAALPGFDPAAAEFTPNGVSHPNPLRDLDDLLDRVVEANVSVIHGDLNLQNILVDEATGFAWLIDFAETRRGPTLFDLQRLEVQVITKLLPQAVAQAGLDPAAVPGLLQALHTDAPSPTAPYTGLQEPYTLLLAVRRLARQYLIDDQDWYEYYLGLVIALVGALKFDELDALARGLALIAAAVVQELIDKPLAIGAPAPKKRPTPLAEPALSPPVQRAPVSEPAVGPARDSSRTHVWIIGIAIAGLGLIAVLGCGLWLMLTSGFFQGSELAGPSQTVLEDVLKPTEAVNVLTNTPAATLTPAAAAAEAAPTAPPVNPSPTPTTVLEVFALEPAGDSARYDEPQLALDGAGTLHLIYQKRPDRSSQFVVYRQLLPDGRWSGPEILNTEEMELCCYDLSLLPNPKGEICAFWQANSEQGHGPYMRCLGEGGWSVPQLAFDEFYTSSKPVFTPDGRVQFIYRNPPYDLFFNEIKLTLDFGKYFQSLLFIDQQGHYHALLGRLDDGSWIEHRTSEDGGQTWSDAARLPEEGKPDAVAVDRKGNAHLVSASSDRRYFRWTPEGGWEPAVELGCRNSAFVNMALGPDDRVHTIWETLDGGCYLYQQPDGTWSQPRIINNQFNVLPVLAVDAQGKRHFVWVGDDNGLYYAVLP